MVVVVGVFLSNGQTSGSLVNGEEVFSEVQT